MLAFLRLLRLQSLSGTQAISNKSGLITSSLPFSLMRRKKEVFRDAHHRKAYTIISVKSTLGKGTHTTKLQIQSSAEAQDEIPTPSPETSGFGRASAENGVTVLEKVTQPLMLALS